MSRKRKHADGRGRPWPEVKMGFKVTGIITHQPTALQKAFVTQFGKLCRHYHLEGVKFENIGKK